MAIPEKQTLNEEKALNWLKGMVHHMERELASVERFFKINKLKPAKLNIPKETVENMKSSYKQISNLVNKYEKSRSFPDFTEASKMLEILEPGFELNYNDIVNKASAAGYQLPVL